MSYDATFRRLLYTTAHGFAKCDAVYRRERGRDIALHSFWQVIMAVICVIKPQTWKCFYFLTKNISHSNIFDIQIKSRPHLMTGHQQAHTRTRHGRIQEGESDHGPQNAKDWYKTDIFPDVRENKQLALILPLAGSKLPSAWRGGFITPLLSREIINRF